MGQHSSCGSCCTKRDDDAPADNRVTQRSHHPSLTSARRASADLLSDDVFDVDLDVSEGHKLGIVTKPGASGGRQVESIGDGLVTTWNTVAAKKISLGDTIIAVNGVTLENYHGRRLLSFAENGHLCLYVRKHKPEHTVVVGRPTVIEIPDLSGLRVSETSGHGPGWEQPSDNGPGPCKTDVAM